MKLLKRRHIYNKQMKVDVFQHPSLRLCGLTPNPFKQQLSNLVQYVSSPELLILFIYSPEKNWANFNQIWHKLVLIKENSS